jgi:hypothetical protein
VSDHLPGCTAKSLAELYPDEPQPPELSDVSWREIKIALCEPGCPVLQRSLDRGVELAREHGW